MNADRTTVLAGLPKLLCFVAVVLFVVAAFGGHISSLGELDLVALGLAFGFASFVI